MGKYLDFPIEITKHNWHDEILPVVSIFNWTYNHKDYVRKSLESILSQKTTFPVEIIIHDDASNDGTKEIILEYQNKYPQLFRNILHEENQYSQGNCIMKPLFQKPRGKYVALLHGDDYWIAYNKLQEQVEFLEANLDYGLVCTNFITYNQKKEVFQESKLIPFDTYYYEDCINWRNQIWTLTSCFRNDLIVDIPRLDEKQYFTGDRIIYLHISLQKKIKFLNECTSVYRILENSMSHFTTKYDSIEFSYKVANTMLFFLTKYPVKSDLYNRLFYKYARTIIKYSFINMNYRIFKNFCSKYPIKLANAYLFLNILILLSSNKIIFNSISFVYSKLFKKNIIT